MKVVKFILFSSSILAFSSIAVSQLINGRLSVSVYAWEKFDTVGTSRHLTRGFSNLQLDVTQDDFSVHTYLSAASHLSGSFGDDASVRFSNAFLRWKNIGNIFDVNIGRVPVFAGAGIGTVDGAMVKARGWNDQMRFTCYGGANVPSDLRSNGFADLDKNFLIGGQWIGSFLERTRIGASYVNRRVKRENYTAIRPDSLFNPALVLVTPVVQSEQVVGFDANYDYTSRYSAYGRYEFDINSKRSLRGEMNVRFHLMSELALSGSYIYREPRVLYNSFFSLFPTEPVHEYEGGVEYTFSPSVSGFGRYAYVRYHDDLSRRLTMGLHCRYGSVSISGSNGYSGQITSVYVQGMYPLLNRMLVPTVGFSFASYRLSDRAQRREDVFAGSFGLVVRPVNSFSADAQLEWLRNKVARNDVRVAAKVGYWFSYNLSPSRSTEAGK